MTPRARSVLFACGALSSLVYVAANVAGSLRWEAYSSVSQSISELSAIGAPSRSVWVPLGIAYDVLLIAFGVGVWSHARGRRRLRASAAMLITIGAIGFFWPPMHLRGDVTTLTDTLHVVWAAVTSVLIFLAIGFGASAFGSRFRRYSIGTIVALLLLGGLSFLDAPRVAANEPTPWLGLLERMNLGAYLLWVVALAAALAREKLHVASDEQRALPGDDLLPGALAQATHHVDIDGRPEDVWPWLTQMGRGRGGWYSWDILDNDGPSAGRILPELQQLAVGDLLKMRPDDPEGVAVLILEPSHALVLGTRSLSPGSPLSGEASRPGEPRATWAFSLDPIDDARTRLVVRVRAEYEPSLAAALVSPIIRAMHDVMERKQLVTIKQRVETT